MRTLWAFVCLAIPNLASAGYCPEHTNLEIQVERRVTAGQPTTVVVIGRHVLGGADCHLDPMPANVTIELSVATSLGGPRQLLARTQTGTAVQFTPTEGVLYLFAQPLPPVDPAVQPSDDTVYAANATSIVAASHWVSIPLTTLFTGRPRARSRGLPTLTLFQPGLELFEDRSSSHDVLASPLRVEADASGTFHVPQTENYYLTGGSLAPIWIHVRSNGTYELTPAAGVIHLSAEYISGFSIEMSMPGIPTQTRSCSAGCSFAFSPAGTAFFRALVGTAVIPFSREVTFGARDRAEIPLCVAHLLAGIAPPIEGCGNLWSLPARRSAVVTANGVCPTCDDPAVIRGEQFPSGTEVRSHDRTIWTEQETSGLRRATFWQVSSLGAVTTLLPINQDASSDWTDEVTSVVGGDTVYVVGLRRSRSYPDRSPQPFVLWYDGSWRRAERRGQMAHVTLWNGRLYFVDGRSLLSCSPTGSRLTCESAIRMRQTPVALWSTDTQLGLVFEDGRIETLNGRRLVRHTDALPDMPPLTQVATVGNRVVGLFGPVITGSEYHPFCARSVLAEARPGGWHILEEVRAPTGRRLRCGYNFAVVSRIRQSGGVLEVERRSAREIRPWAPMALD